jgi:hypothetical protein
MAYMSGLGGKSDLTLLKARRKDRTDFDRLFCHIVATNEKRYFSDRLAVAGEEMDMLSIECEPD